MGLPVLPHAASTPLVPTEFYGSFKFEELSEATNAFSRVNFLGSGSFGAVFKGFSEGGEPWAVKRGHKRMIGNFGQMVRRKGYFFNMFSRNNKGNNLSNSYQTGYRNFGNKPSKPCKIERLL